MILNSTILKVCDNSGAKYVKCFKIFKDLTGNIGSILYISVKSTYLNNKIHKGFVIKAIVIRTKNCQNRKNGNFISFNLNEVVLLNQKHEFLGTRIFGPIPLELRKKHSLRLLSLSSYFL
jgi:large subunit ribosomal protein L14